MMELHAELTPEDEWDICHDPVSNSYLIRHDGGLWCRIGFNLAMRIDTIAAEKIAMELQAAVDRGVTGQVNVVRKEGEWIA